MSASSRMPSIARCYSRPAPRSTSTPSAPPEGEALGPAPFDPAARAARTAEAVTRALVGRTVAQVEQDLILDTLDHFLGNRTHAAKILGISIRTLRNKLGEYTAAGAAVPEPGQARVMGV
jgi:two-component system response regulator FlrC